MLSRRTFLKNLATTAVALSLDPFKGVAIAGAEYSNHRLGLSVRLPKNWEFGSIADFAAIREHSVLLDELEDMNEPHPLKDPSNLPVFLFENPAFKRGEFVPAIALYDEPLHEQTPSDQVAAHERMLIGFGNSYTNRQIIEYPYGVTLSGATATWSKWSYLHELENGDTYALSVRSILVFQTSRVHTYHLADDLHSPCIEEDVWSDFLASIAYVK